MSEEMEAKEQRKSLLSKRFTAPTVETTGKRRGRPSANVYRKHVSFFLQPEVIDEFDNAYHCFKVKLGSRKKVDKATFREAAERKAITYLDKIVDDFQR